MTKTFIFLLIMPLVLFYGCAGLPTEGRDGAGNKPVTISYAFENIPEKYRPYIKKSMDIWAEYIEVQFIENPILKEADIIFKWKKIDGPKDTHGTTRFIFNQTFISFDKDNLWETYPAGAFLNVSTHELGHALGLKHSKNPESIMYVNPYVDVYNPKIKLFSEDIQKIQSIYKPRL